MQLRESPQMMRVHDFSTPVSRNRAIFLDRDGVINVNHGYVHRPENFDFMDGIFDAASAAHAQHYKLVVITNQAGIARGYYSEQQFHELTHWMFDQFAMQGAPVAKVYFSPYHPTAGIGEYKKDDISRKLHPGMILQAQQELNLDLENSILIGDKASDVQAGIASGMGTNILLAQSDPIELLSSVYHRISAVRDALPFLTFAQSLAAEQ
jgi:D-glycero-D-manno-heptose 1,7-bisphosphate phosphatase